MALDRSFIEIALKAKNYREFLTEVFGLLKKRDKNFTLHKFSKQAGFKSRSLVTDVLNGRRRITAKTLPGFINALNLTTEVAEHFTNLVMIEERSLHFGDRQQEKVQEQLARATKRLDQLNKLQEKLGSDVSIYDFLEWPAIYAALGDERGTSVQDIARKIKLTKLETRQLLEKMRQRGIVGFDSSSGHYLARDDHLLFSTLAEKDSFKEFYLNSLDICRKKAQHKFNSPDAIFINSVLSVRKDKVEEFRQELMDLTQKFLVKTEDPHGDAIANFLVSFFI